ncbi:DegT/DnrJ/EryC1/StrS family aminotransferase [Nonomuraea sp. NPDC050404]|uniref:DegT/DnrJ/EryC1/StrS family aminotransferase n=1 Tax=Nonomuraea sp. NPDC050404 TaxID=3155783 RepID=UPI0033CA5E63
MSTQPLPEPIPHRPVWPEIDDLSVQAIQAALLSGRLAVSGPPSRWPSRNVMAAEALAGLARRRHATLTASGSSAIVIALQAADVGPGDVVLLPATTWVACATAVLRVGAVPAFFDGTAESPCLVGHSPVDSPRAVLGVHLYAQQCDVAALRRRFPDAVLIEDASHAQLAETAGGRVAGSLGDISIMSTQATKILAAGEGGVVLTDDDELAARIESLMMDSRRRLPGSAPGLLNEPERELGLLNELEPAGRQHGANHAMSEVSAALLLDQLARLPDQARRRATGLACLLERLAGTDWQAFADEGARRSGNFYGVAVRLPEHETDAGDLVAKVGRETGIVLDRVYPPMPEGPLYRPATVKQYAGLGELAGPLERARHWHDRHVVIPHHLFLAGEPTLDALATVMTGETRRTRTVPRRRPLVEVVVVTRGERPRLLAAALESVAAQRDLDADISVTVWHDKGAGAPGAVLLPSERDEGAGATGTLELDGVRLTTVGHSGAVPAEPWTRVATLRQFAVDRRIGDYLTFLDDDNTWAPDHLAALLALARRGYPAVHSWRRMIDADGNPVLVDRFPWLPPGDKAIQRLAELASAGMMSADSSVIRDAVRRPDGGVGMVDMGEWLFDSKVLPLLRIATPRSAAEVEERIGEDDLLLRQIVRLGIPTASTQRETLRYRLGGMSNPEMVTR